MRVWTILYLHDKKTRLRLNAYVASEIFHFTWIKVARLRWSLLQFRSLPFSVGIFSIKMFACIGKSSKFKPVLNWRYSGHTTAFMGFFNNVHYSFYFIFLLISDEFDACWASHFITSSFVWGNFGWSLVKFRQVLDAALRCRLGFASAVRWGMPNVFRCW